MAKEIQYVIDHKRFKVHVILQFKHLNIFETIKTNGDSQTNFSTLIKIMKKLEPFEVDNDFRNNYLAFKLTRHGFSNWLTFISLDNQILMNERPNTWAFWWSMNYRIMILKLLKEKDEL